MAAQLRTFLTSSFGDRAESRVETMAERLKEELRPWRVSAALFAIAGLLALLVAAVGVYSTIAYAVTQRMHEMGVRVALGAAATDIRSLVLRQGLRVAALGLAAGVVLALFAGRFVEPLLYRTSTRDPLIYGVVLLILLAVATVASLVPARRATRADPLVALRAE